MGLTRHAITFGIGYAVGNPEGRRSLLGLRGQIVELLRRPEVKQVRERGWDVAGDAVLATRNRLTARARSAAATGEPTRAWRRFRFRSATPLPAIPDGTAGDGAAPATEFAGTTVAEDSKAALLGTAAPPRPAEQPQAGTS